MAVATWQKLIPLCYKLIYHTRLEAKLFSRPFLRLFPSFFPIYFSTFFPTFFSTFFSTFFPTFCGRLLTPIYVVYCCGLREHCGLNIVVKTRYFSSVESQNGQRFAVLLILTFVLKVSLCDGVRLAKYIPALQECVAGREGAFYASTLLHRDSDVITCDSIGICFSSLKGLQRRPVARTRVSILKLPTFFESFPTLAEEFTIIIRTVRHGHLT